MSEKTHSAGDSGSKLRTRLLALFLIVFLCIVAAEVASRAFWSHYGVPFFDPGRILYVYYPEMAKADRDRPTRGDGHYNVLFLGGSVLHRDWGSVEEELRTQLASRGLRNVRIYNFAMPGHTSRDSLLKYAALDKDRFDLVVFYHGINDARANNAPPDVFRADYSHYIWYEMVNTMARYHGRAHLALPYTLRFLAVSLHQALNKDRYIPFSNLRDDWVKYGGTLRGADSFRENLSAILDTAARRGDRIMIMTFATCVPRDYVPESYAWPLEKWGRREFVLAAVRAHNDIVKSTAMRHPEIVFLDQAALMSGDARNFNDPCHLSAAGSRKFVENMLSALQRGTAISGRTS